MTSLAVTCAALCSHVVTRFVYVTVNDYYCPYRALALSVMLASSLGIKYTVANIVEDDNTESGQVGTRVYMALIKKARRFDPRRRLNKRVCNTDCFERTTV